MLQTSAHVFTHVIRAEDFTHIIHFLAFSCAYAGRLMRAHFYNIEHWSLRNTVTLVTLGTENFDISRLTSAQPRCEPSGQGAAFYSNDPTSNLGFQKIMFLLKNKTN